VFRADVRLLRLGSQRRTTDPRSHARRGDQRTLQGCRCCASCSPRIHHNFLWCLFLIVRNRSGGEFLAVRVLLRMRTACRAAAAELPLVRARRHAVVLPVLFLHDGESQMGDYKFSSWTLHMASIILFSTLWGFALKEWPAPAAARAGWCGRHRLTGRRNRHHRIATTSASSNSVLAAAACISGCAMLSPGSRVRRMNSSMQNLSPPSKRCCCSKAAARCSNLDCLAPACRFCAVHGAATDIR